eukprot:4248753-Alexandrium_andersonii.AAC.1
MHSSTSPASCRQASSNALLPAWSSGIVMKGGCTIFPMRASNLWVKSLKPSKANNLSVSSGMRLPLPRDFAGGGGSSAGGGVATFATFAEGAAAGGDFASDFPATGERLGADLPTFPLGVLAGRALALEELSPHSPANKEPANGSSSAASEASDTESSSSSACPAASAPLAADAADPAAVVDCAGSSHFSS